ncbi:methyl-accepting chemotaxis protein [Chitinibacter sp. ZOR0017]|uniref:methyl-accepting chemotaxis protein n=1 Tax=Chitinibacter sp. ZOR0017 TaxID=1339254 RepID=UPI000689C8E3|nr:methyl-accepting chemotaxis protein [Chitinibacter sp. ZOR0017]
MSSKLTIAAKITLGFVVMIVLIIAVGLAGLMGLRQSANVVQELLSTDLEYGIAMNELGENVLHLRRFEKDLFINLSNPEKVKEYKTKWDKTLGDAKAALDKAAPVANDERKKAIAELQTGLDDYAKAFNEVAGEVAAGKYASTGEANQAFDKHKAVVRKLGEDSAEHAKEAMTAVKAIAGKVEAQRAATNQITIVLLLLAIAAAVIAAVVISRSVRQPLNQMQRDIDEMDRTGHIGRRLTANQHDEIGQTSTALNRLFTGMCEVIGLANRNSGELLSAARELTNASEQIAQASRQQAEASASTAAAVEQMSVSVNMIADNTLTMESEAREASVTASEGTAIAKKAAVEINQIADSINRSSETIVQLNQRSDEIGSIAMVIKDIADQTNLLALNAAIEAARAGDLGRGFAVVADEVRKLAERTTQATVEITSKIDSVQRDTSLAAEGMRSAGQLVESGVRSTESVADALSAIENVTRRSVEHIGSISGAIKEQSIASQEIARNVEKIAQVSEENHSAAENTNQLAGRLTQIAEGLDKTIRRFTV